MGDLDLTLVCHYGDKPAPLAALLRALVTFLHQRWGKAFEAYSLGQMHATLIGLERDLVDGKRINRWFWKHRGEQRSPDAERLAELVETTPCLPFRVRFGGFSANTRYPFTSRNQHPYQRMFQVQGDQVVLMGWPDHAGTFPRTLAELRHAFESADVLHKYHADPNRADDNDLFLVLGRLDRSARLDAPVEGVEFEARQLLANTTTMVDIDRDALTLVRYTDPGLPVDQCQCFRSERHVFRTLLGAL